MRHTKHNDRGFTLIEFVLAALAGMILLAATFTLMNTVFGSGANMNPVMQTQQNLRVAMNTITREITMAGTGLPTGGIAVPSGTNSAPLDTARRGRDLNDSEQRYCGRRARRHRGPDAQWRGYGRDHGCCN